MKIAKKITAYLIVITLAVVGIRFISAETVSADNGISDAETVSADNGISDAETVSAETSKIGTMDFLKADGKVLKNCYGNGDTVYLRGTNAGGYMLQEIWLTPTEYSTNVNCQMDILNKLKSRFGSDSARTLIKTYEEHYWTEADFDTCASLGINCIRLPVWYRNFVDENNNWYDDAFDRMDWFVEEAGKRGIYVIIDMHGAYGSQNGIELSGVYGGEDQVAASEFFFGDHAADNQEKYYQMWEKIAAHYNGNPAVAGYDLLNEPYCEYRYESEYSDSYLHTMLWDIYDKAYDRIRKIDGDHVIIMEGIWDPWDLPAPSKYGWENVMYEYHCYEYSDYDNEEGTQISSIKKKMTNISVTNYNVPTYIGEFCFFDSMDAWDEGLKILNDNGLNWTSWSYKCVAEYKNWGLANQSVEHANIENDSYSTILNKWSKAGESYLNTDLVNVFQKYTPGTVEDKNAAFITEGNYFLNCNDKVVCAEDGGNAPLVADRDIYGGDWENFYIINNDDGTISLKSVANGKYVCAVIDEEGQLLARSDVISLWEKFYLIHIQENQYGLRAVANGKYVKADFDDTSNSGQLKAVSSSIAGAWEAFYFEKPEEETATEIEKMSTEREVETTAPPKAEETAPVQSVTEQNENVSSLTKTPARAKIIKVNVKKKSSPVIKISLKKIKGVSGYQIKITKKKKSGKALIKRIVKKRKVTMKSPKIKNKKRLFVRVRAYKQNPEGKKVFGRWSKAKKVKIKN